MLRWNFKPKLWLLVKWIKMTIDVRKKGMFSAYFRVWANTFHYKGRATRYEFLSFVFINILLFILTRFSPLYNLLNLASFITFPALCVRRFHDQGKSGKFVCIPYLSIVVCFLLLFNVKMSENVSLCIMALPLLLFVIMWILLLIRGSDGDNQFGKKIAFDEDISDRNSKS